MEVPPPSYPQVDTPSLDGVPDALPGYGHGDSSTPSQRVFMPSAGVDDKLPNHFKISNQYVKAQVMPSDLEAHLVLLGAFHRLREEVRTFKGKADIPMEPDERYAVFLQRAVYRFEQWAVRMIGGEGQEEEALDEGTPKVLVPDEVPPLDVTMIWHTYMLNLRSYYEDCIRKLPGLLRIGSFPLMQLAGSIDRETLLPHPPSENRAAAFSSFTGQPFDPPTNTTSEDTVVVFCPSCSQPNTIPWITYKGDGYAQRGFSCACNSCQFSFSRETLGVRKFYDDMENCLLHADKYFMANTIVDYQTGVPVDKRWSKALSTLVIGNHQGNLKAARPEKWGKQIGWTMKNLEDYCRVGMMFWQNKPHISTPRARKLKDIIGVVPDHDDKVSQGALSDAYDKTAEAWKARFGVPYSVCGCLPPTKSLEVPGSDSRGSFWLFAKKGKSKVDEHPKFENSRPDLISVADEAAGQMHPSDHNAVAIINPGEQNTAQAQLRKTELGKREKELQKSIEKGRADQWAEVVRGRVTDHTPSFLCPVQYGVQDPFGKFGHGDCTALSGSGVKGNFGVGECCKGNGTHGLCGAQIDRARGGPLDSVAYATSMSGDAKLAGRLGITELGGATAQAMASAGWTGQSMSF
ncbi:hypothetical protein FRC01_008603 [Tulasnella sp. 417]|nr:hypothetical protein FRC01_008603 [Tulasnella sp. 417]